MYMIMVTSNLTFSPSICPLRVPSHSFFLQDDCTTWTDEKHGLYLEHLEVSFVKQLHQSMGLLAQCSEQNKRDKNISQLRPINVHIASEQYGCWEKINFKRGDPLSHVSPDSHNPLKSPWVYRLKRTGMHCPPPSADMPDFLTLCGTQNPRKVITSHGLETCPQQISASSQYHGDFNDLMREGTGQNFVDEDNQNKSNTKSRVKRLKTALAD
ncbi:hypothetical protein Pfo_004774 [Paulownia fortunei]|nr:hypothetical protein Pfo_004774 [Paulownia fortunei]